jgi:DNA polymerase I-like protein with 3'-5' exonuclease and polymerase domains
MSVPFPNSELLLSRNVVAGDSETTGLTWWRDRPFGISLSWHSDQGEVQSWYGDLRESGVLRWLKDHLPRIRKWVNHHLKFDYHMLREVQVVVPMDRISCTLIRECILDEDQFEYSLDSVAYRRLGERKEDIWPELARLYGGEPTKDAQIANLPRAPYELTARYANVDSALALKLWEAQQKEIVAEDLQMIDALEQELLGVVIEMERVGVRVDLDRAQFSVKQLDADIKESQRELDHLVGGSVNVNSPVQAKRILGVHKADDGTWRTKDGVLLEPTESGNSGSLRTEKLYQSSLPEATLIAEIRAMIKARDVFLKKYILGMSHKGYIHANINQTRTEEGDGTYTGRFSITEPALQQIHKRNKKMAAIVRSCFIPDPDCEWGCFDWSQKDFRIFAHYVNDPTINRIYRDNPAADFHKVTSDLTGLPRDRDQKTGGANAKQMNLGLIFGMSAGRMAKEMFLPYTMRGTCQKRGCRMNTDQPICPNCGSKVELFFNAGPEATALFSKYHTAIPGANRLKGSVSSVAKSRGYIKTLLGRRLRFPNANHAYKAAGILFQGQAAESMKAKMCELAEYIRAYPEYLSFRLVVHDEFDLYLKQGRPSHIDKDVKHLLETFDGTSRYPLKYRIPILADYGTGANWYEASV